ncbi:MAG: leucine-rich repeat domain-containing protein [Prevotella sp.]|nr:leucine-rich repeat domain-containing protein [Prevotella sp.]
MKRINVFWLSLLMALTALPVSAFDFEIDGIKYDITGTNEVCVSSGGDRNTEVVVIPSEVTNDGTTYSVTSIGENAFKFGYRPKLTSVTIPASIKKIGSNAFSGCILLTEIHISDIAAWCSIEFANKYSNPLGNRYNSTSSLGASLYLNGEKITELIIPEGVTDIKQYAFYEGRDLTSVDIPATLKSIGNSAFNNCSNLTKINIHDIAAWCNIIFEDYTDNPLSYTHNLYLNGEKVTDLIIPDGVTSINKYAFYGCSMTSVTIPGSVKEIHPIAFTECTNLTSVHINDIAAWCAIIFEDNPLIYAHNLYLNGEKVTDLIIPDGVTSIEDYAFYGLNDVASVKLPASLTKIGNNAFVGCSGLSEITIPNSVTSIGKGAFVCSDLTSAVFEDGETPLTLDVYIFASPSLERVYIGRNTDIYVGPIVDAPKLSQVTIGNTVTSLGRGLFATCTGLTSIDIPNSVTIIGDHCFEGCTSLTSVTIPNSVTQIGQSCFRDCTGLTSITIPNSITYIDADCFRGCTGLTSITIPNGVTNIIAGAFQECSGLTSVDIPNSITEIGSSSFLNCTGLTAVNIHDIVAWCNINFRSNPLTYAHNLYLNGELVTDLVIPEGVTSDMNLAFARCTSLTSVVIPNSVTSIGRAFDSCINLTSITIPSSINNINPLAFNRSGLTSIKLLNTNPPTVSDGSFYDTNIYQATLYVPIEAVETYRTTDPWKNFTNIQGIDISGIKDVKANGDPRQNTCYDLNGRKLNGPKTGLNIINGKKVMVKNDE